MSQRETEVNVVCPSKWAQTPNSRMPSNEIRHPTETCRKITITEVFHWN